MPYQLLQTVAIAVLGTLIGGVLAPDLPEMFSGLVRICTLPAQLTKDYFSKNAQPDLRK